MIRTLRDGRLQAVIVFCMIMAFLMPVKARRRVVIQAKTPVVLQGVKSMKFADSFNVKYGELINAAALEYNIPAPLIAAVIKAESNFRPSATSHAGAMGLMQVTYDTWLHLGGEGSPYNPTENVMLGTKYLRNLLDLFEGDLVLTLAAYNAGPGAVKKYKSVPPYSETRRYIPKVLAYYKKYLGKPNYS